MMRRENNDWLVWLIVGMLGVLVVATAVFENLNRYELNVQQTVAQPIVGVSGLTDDGLVNINTADAATLMTVDGIGSTLAQRIIDYREEHGNFQSVDELIEIKGIGEKTLEKIRRYLGVE